MAKTKMPRKAKIIEKKKTKIVLAIAVLLLVGCLIGIRVVLAQGAEAPAAAADNSLMGALKAAGGLAVGFFGNLFVKGVNVVLYIIFQVVGFFLILSMWLLNTMTSAEIYKEVFFSEAALAAINQGWLIVRDFFNLFFMLILLLIAIGTILRVSKFSDRKMVFSVIMAALLINFSKPIALMIIDLSQLAMNFFMEAINGSSAEFSALLLNKMDFQKIIGMNGEKAATGMVMLLFSIIFIFVMAVMLFILAASLVIRMISFWVLIILSPMAMFGLALPGTAIAQMKTTWFRKMVYWSFYGPVLLFFLWLALVVINTFQATIFGNFGEFAAKFSIPVIKEGGFEDLIKSLLGIAIPYISAIYLLFYGYDISRSMANQAGSSVGGLMNWGQKKMGEWSRRWSRQAAFGAAAAGTLGIAPMVYYGGKGISRRLKSEWGAIKKGISKRDSFKWAAKDEEAEKEREEERAARIAGGETLNKYYRKKAAETEKKWKETGEPDDLWKVARGGNRAEALAAINLLAQRGKLTSAQEYKEAMDLTENDKVMQHKIRTAAEKKNLNAVLDYDIENNREKLIDGLIKAENKRRQQAGRATLNKDEETQLRNVLRGERGDINQAKNSKVDVNFLVHAENLRRREQGEKRLTKEEKKRLYGLADNEGNVEIGHFIKDGLGKETTKENVGKLLEYNLNNAVYRNKLKEMSLDDILVKQANGFLEKSEVLDYLQSRSEKMGKQFQNELRNKVYKDANVNKLNTLIKGGIINEEESGNNNGGEKSGKGGAI